MGYFRALFSGWVTAMGTILTIAAIGSYIASDVCHKDLPVPPWLALPVGVLAFLFVSHRLWFKNESFASAFRKSLKDRCDEVILGWEKLAEDYQNSPKAPGQSPTLPNPMDRGWVSYELKVWPYRVGFLQASTTTLRRDMKGASMQVEEWNYSRISMAETLNALRKYEKQIGKLN